MALLDFRRATRPCVGIRTATAELALSGITLMAPGGGVNAGETGSTAQASNNLGIVAWGPQGAHVNFMVRSLREAGNRAPLATRIIRARKREAGQVYIPPAIYDLGDDE